MAIYLFINPKRVRKNSNFPAGAQINEDKLSQRSLMFKTALVQYHPNHVPLFPFPAASLHGGKGTCNEDGLAPTRRLQ
jgi:hypothetical protein